VENQGLRPLQGLSAATYLPEPTFVGNFFCGINGPITQKLQRGMPQQECTDKPFVQSIGVTRRTEHQPVDISIPKYGRRTLTPTLGNCPSCHLIENLSGNTDRPAGGNDERMDNLVRDSANRLAWWLYRISRG
jgi:hypothetical protein